MSGNGNLLGALRARELLRAGSSGRCRAAGPSSANDGLSQLKRWAEGDLIRRCTATYCDLLPHPRSTIATAFSPDGRLLASTHGDHTVKIISCTTGECIKTLEGHRRTPWVVRWHPSDPDVLASGSLDAQVRVWNLRTDECTMSRQFNRAIASLAFVPESPNWISIATGHKLYMWDYQHKGSQPAIVLKTRRSLRAVHFHPHGAPLVLTAELINPSPASDLGPPMGEQHPAAAAGPWLPGTTDRLGGGGGGSSERNAHASQWEAMLSAATAAAAAVATGPVASAAAAPPPGGQPMDQDMRDRGRAPPSPHGGLHAALTAQQQQQQQQPYLETAAASPQQADSGGAVIAPAGGSWQLAQPPALPPLQPHRQPPPPQPQQRDGIGGGWAGTSGTSDGSDGPQAAVGNQWGSNGGDWRHGTAAAAAAAPQPVSVSPPPAPRSTHGLLPPSMLQLGPELPLHLLAHVGGGAGADGLRALGLQQQQHPHTEDAAAAHDAAAAPYPRHQHGGGGGGVDFDMGDGGGVRMAGGGAAASAAVAGAVAAWRAVMGQQEQPDRVRLRLWRYRPQEPCAPLSTLLLGVSDAVLCSEMGAHFSPDGRMLAACIACAAPLGQQPPAPTTQPVLSAARRQPGTAGSPDSCSGGAGDGGGAGSSSDEGEGAAEAPHRPVSYEVRVMSVEPCSLGAVLAARQVRAAHILTSVQFSPSSKRLLLAYGRRHISLLRSVTVDGGSIIPLHTVLEVYRVSDMALLRELPSAEDEVNAACFHPQMGGGIAYGTKEGRLRVIRHDRLPVACGPTRDGSGSWRGGLEEDDDEDDDRRMTPVDADMMQQQQQQGEGHQEGAPQQLQEQWQQRQQQQHEVSADEEMTPVV